MRPAAAAISPRIRSSYGATPFFGQKRTPFLDRAAALKMKESQCQKFARVTHQPEGQGGRGGHQGTQDGGPDRADIRGPPDSGCGWKKQALPGCPTSLVTVRADAPAVDPEKDELYKQIGQLKVELDFLQKKSWPHRLKTSAMDRSHHIRGSPSNGSANCWECRARPATISRSRRARRPCA